MLTYVSIVPTLSVGTWNKRKEFEIFSY